MSVSQHALIVKVSSDRTTGLDELNVKLGRGWRVVKMTPLGGAGTGSSAEAELCLAALVIIEREADEHAAVMEQAEEEAEEIVDEIVEGNGAGPPIEDPGEEPGLS